MTIFEQIKAAGLTGRGGADFPTDVKWLAVAEAVTTDPEHKSYIVCNGAEGESGVMKDGYILQHYPKLIIDGIATALTAFKSEQAVIYLRKSYFKKYRSALEKIIRSSGLPIVLRAETGGYLCGEETTLLETLEGRVAEPRLRPPYPTESGYLGYPTLINNVETFYCVGLIARGKFNRTRFYTVSGAVKHPGVFELSQDLNVKQVLAMTNNQPAVDYFVQVGGGASGRIFIADELEQARGGAITVYDRAKTKPVKLMKTWLTFFYQENCGKCVPCREGVGRLLNILNETQPDWAEMKPILRVLKETSFCPLGRSVFFPMDGLLNKVIDYEN